MNLVSLYGRVANDLELHYTNSGKAVVQFSIAVRGYNDKSNFIRCQAWEKRAENLANYFHKGSRIGVTGQLVSGRYDKDGQTHYTQDVVVNTFDFVDSKQESQHLNHGNDEAIDTAASRTNSQIGNTKRGPFENNGNQIDISDDDVPF